MILPKDIGQYDEMTSNRDPEGRAIILALLNDLRYVMDLNKDNLAIFAAIIENGNIGRLKSILENFDIDLNDNSDYLTLLGWMPNDVYRALIEAPYVEREHVIASMNFALNETSLSGDILALVQAWSILILTTPEPSGIVKHPNGETPVAKLLTFFPESKYDSSGGWF